MLFRKSKFYEKTATLRGPQDAVSALSFSAHGRFIAAVGASRLFLSRNYVFTPISGHGGAAVWNAATSSPVNVPSTVVQVSPRQQKRIFDCALWMYFKHPRDEHILVLGSLHGNIVFLSWNAEQNVRKLRILFALCRSSLILTAGVQNLSSFASGKRG